MQKIRVIAIVGPTASGKSDVAFRVAKAVGGEVLCVDSRTVYRGMDVGTAKGSGWGTDLVNPDEAFTVADFVEYAKVKIDEIVSWGKVPVLVGGTGLYFRALLDGLTLADVAPNEVLRAEWEGKSTDELVEMLRVQDANAVNTIDTKNRRRVLRALEIVTATGAPLSERQQKVATPYDVCWIGVDVPTDELFRRIDARVDEMIANGLEAEVRVLYEKYGGSPRAMSGIGYHQFVEYFEGKTTLDAAIARIKTDTRSYAKRQRTWFKADKRIQWVTSLRSHE